MPRLQIHLKGWKQITVAVLALIGLVAGYSLSLQSGLESRLPALVEERLKIDLQQDVARRTLPIGKGTTPTREQGERFVQEHNKLDRLKILSTEKRGWGKKIVVKVTFTFDESTSNEETRFYRLR